MDIKAVCDGPSFMLDIMIHPPWRRRHTLPWPRAKRCGLGDHDDVSRALVNCRWKAATGSFAQPTCNTGLNKANKSLTVDKGATVACGT